MRGDDRRGRPPPPRCSSEATYTGRASLLPSHGRGNGGGTPLALLSAPRKHICGAMIAAAVPRPRQWASTPPPCRFSVATYPRGHQCGATIAAAVPRSRLPAAPLLVCGDIPLPPSARGADHHGHPAILSAAPGRAPPSSPLVSGDIPLALSRIAPSLHNVGHLARGGAEVSGWTSRGGPEASWRAIGRFGPSWRATACRLRRVPRAA